MSNQRIGPNQRLRSSFEVQSLLSHKDLMQPHLLEVDEATVLNEEKFQSRDTLQSLVQSCSCGSRSHEMSNSSHGDGIQGCRRHPLQPQRLRNLNYGTNIGIERYYYSKPQLDKQFSLAPSDARVASEKDAMKHKMRIRWTEDLHKRFIECVDQLGGAKKATPKGILNLMKCDGLTIFHVKSHLQKYRVAEIMPEAKEVTSTSFFHGINAQMINICECDERNKINGLINTHTYFAADLGYNNTTMYSRFLWSNAGEAEQLGSTTGVQIVEALRLQMDVQHRLYEQLESQKKLQMRIEEQAKQLQTMLECQLKTK